MPENHGKFAVLRGIDDCRFKRIVEPGDVLELECEFMRVRGPIGKGKVARAWTASSPCEAMLTVVGRAK